MSFNSIKPARGHYVLEHHEIEQGGTFRIAEDAKKKSEIGKIVGVGGVLRREGETTEPEYEIGEVVAYKPYTGHSVKLGSKELLTVAFEDVTGKLIEGENE